MRRPLVFVSLALVLGAAFAATVFWNGTARATSLAPPPFPPSPVVAVAGHAALIADDLVVPPATQVWSRWADTGACERMFLVVRDYETTSESLEFYTSMDGAGLDTWWTGEVGDNFDVLLPDLGAESYTFSFFSAHGKQPAAAPYARVSFKHGEATARTVGKAWIHCVG